MEKTSGWSYADFARLPDDGLRYELFEGFLVREPPPTATHQRIVSRLVYLLGDHLGPTRREGVFTSPIAVVLSPQTVLQPDVLYVSPDRFSIIMEDAVHGAPDVVIEVLSPSTRERDLTTKRSLYARAGVDEYWVIDPVARLVVILAQPCDGSYSHVAQYGLGDTGRSPGLGCRIPVAGLLSL